MAASGPALVRVTVKVIVSPTLGRGSLTVLLSCRSDCCGVSVALAWLLPVCGSNWSLWPTLAVLVSAWGPSTSAVKVRVWETPGARVPTAQIARKGS